MNRSSLFVLLVVAGCNDTAYLGHLAPEDPTGPMITVNGIVTDSLLGGALPGVRVAAGKHVTNADATGQWTLEVPEGTVTFSTSPAGYERVSETLEVRSTLYLNLMARRLAPVVQECVRDGDTVRAQVTDLQGRKTVERWERSTAIILDPAGSYRVGAINWGYEPKDILTWEVRLGPLSPAVALVAWEVYDSEGHLYAGICEPVTVVVGEQ